MIFRKTPRCDTRKLFLTKGACSHTFFYILNREFGCTKPDEERASDPFAGGILQQGYQCGMLWGASLAVGAESWRRCGDVNCGCAMAIQATRHVVASFVNRTKFTDCEDITRFDFTHKYNIVLALLTGKFVSCLQLAQKWTPDAIRSATEGLSLPLPDDSEPPFSCASEVAKQMGASDAEIVTVAGFAGGMGLGGGGCGALGAAIWLNTLARIRANDYKPSISDPAAERILTAFYQETGGEMECRTISGQQFETLEQHSQFLKNGGCANLIRRLAVSAG